MFDVLVAGAGPAGSTAALALEREGLSVTIVEPAAFPRTKVCGEYLSAATVRELLAAGGVCAVQGQAHELRSVRIASGRACVSMHFEKPGWALERATLDAALLQAARSAGADVVRGRVEHFEREGDGFCVSVRDGRGDLSKLRCRVIAGADGAHSAVARIAGLHRETNERRRFAIGGHYANLSGLEDAVQMFVDGRTYLAVNPFSRTRANVMLIVYEDELRANRSGIDAFVGERARRLSHGAIDLRRATLEKRVSTGPLAHRTKRFTAPGLLLIGDAAHFVDPFTGQGVYLALYGARLAAAAIRDTMIRAIPQAQAWHAYERALRAELARRSRFASLASLAVRFPALAPLAPAFTPLLHAVSA